MDAVTIHLHAFALSAINSDIDHNDYDAFCRKHSLDSKTPPWILYLRQYADIPLRDSIYEREEYMTIAKWGLNEAFMNMDEDSCKEIMDLLEGAVASVVNKSSLPPVDPEAWDAAHG